MTCPLLARGAKAVLAFLPLFFVANCAFLDPRTPCAGDNQCPGQNTCLADGFCSRTDGGEAVNDAGDGGDAGLPTADGGDVDAGDRDGGLPGDDGGQSDAGPNDAGGDAGPLDAGNIDAGNVDAGNIDAGNIDAGNIDGGAFDGGAFDGGDADDGGPIFCPEGGIPNDPANCGACGLTCASGACLDDVCAPHEVGFVPGIATAFALDGLRLHAYYARNETQLYRANLVAEEAPLLLENNVGIVDLKIDRSRIAAISERSGTNEILIGSLPVGTVGALVRHAVGLGSNTDQSGNKLGMSFADDALIIGQASGQAEFNFDPPALTQYATDGRYFPHVTDSNIVLSLDATGAIHLRERLETTITPPPGGSLECQANEPIVWSSAILGTRHLFGATCPNQGAGFFAVNSAGDLSQSVLLKQVTPDDTALVVDLVTIDDGVYVGLQSGFAFSIQYVRANGQIQSVIDDGVGVLVGLESTDDALFLATTNTISEETRFYRIEALP